MCVFFGVVQEASVFVFEKRVADKLHKPKRKETITEILRFSVRQLDRFKHPKLLTLYHPIEEANETLAFATEPVLGSLANILSCLEDRLPQCLPPEVRDYQFLDIEIKYGLLQLTEALSFLHYSCKLIHRNLSPQSVIVNKRGTWKLAGLEFTEKCNETDLLSPVSCQPFTSKLPKMGQPDLDYTAPEVQAASSCSPLSDMFSLGLIVCSLFNGGRSIIEGNLSTTTYNKQLEVLEGSLHNMLDRVPHHLQEPLQGLLQVDPRRRPNAQNFSMIKYFMDPAVHGLQYLDVIQMKDSTHKSHFYHSLKTALPNIPKNLYTLHPPSKEATKCSTRSEAHLVLPYFARYLKNRVLKGNAKVTSLRCLFCQNSIYAVLSKFDRVKITLVIPQSSNLLCTLLQALFIRTLSNTVNKQTQSAKSRSDSAIPQSRNDTSAVHYYSPPPPNQKKKKRKYKTFRHVDAEAATEVFLSKSVQGIRKNRQPPSLPLELSREKIPRPTCLAFVFRIYKHMLSDKRYGLTVNLIATKVMPALIPVVVSPALKLDQFTSLIELLQEMLEHVSKSQRNKLKLEKLSIPSTDMLPVQMQYTMEQPTGYPHRPPSLRLESRRTSISMDDVVRRTCSSASSSPDSNLLRVQATLPGRRHSDNTIQPPRILVAPCSPEGTVSYTPGGLPIRRHSSVGTQDSRFSGFFSSPKMASASPNLGVDFFSSSRANVRRYSAAAVCGAAGIPNAANQASSFLQQIGSGVHLPVPPPASPRSHSPRSLSPGSLSPRSLSPRSSPRSPRSPSSRSPSLRSPSSRSPPSRSPSSRSPSPRGHTRRLLPQPRPTVSNATIA
ncbi:unnamed protein product [Ixodes pacificus]